MGRLIALALALLPAPLSAQRPTIAQPLAQAPTPASLAARTPNPPPKLPVAAFTAEPLLRDLALSPDGRHLLGTMTRLGQRVPGVLDLDTGKLQPYSLPEKTEFRWARWAGNQRFLVSLKTEVGWGDTTVSASRLIAIELGKPSAVYLGLKNEGLIGDDLLWVDPTGGSVLMDVQPSIYDYPAVYRFDLATGKADKVVAAAKGILDWRADSAGVVRAGLSYDGRRVTLYYRRDGDAEFKRVEQLKLGDDQDRDREFYQLSLSPGSDEGFLLSNKQDGRTALFRYNYATRTLGEQIFAAPANDVTDYDLSSDNKSVEAVRYADDRDRVVWFDPRLKQHQADIDKAVGGRQATIVTRSRDGGRMIVYVGASNSPGTYYLYDVAGGRMNKLIAVNPSFKSSDLPETHPISYTARDGTVIPAYLTLPKGREAKGLPLVILPHGGPYGIRDTLGFDTHAQFLANRSYAVLQPNFRGSGGYGRAFYEQGEGQWGRAMQDDLDDGMDWLVKQGVADAKRTCLVGLSYGGYAALWGVTRNPERYRCAASFAGISDVRKMLQYDRNLFANPRYRSDWQRRVRGDEGFDLSTVSPYQQLARLRAPVLLAHGSDDRNVPVKQSKSYFEALQRAGKTVEYREYAKEGHGPNTSENFSDWLTRLERFLTKYNPA